MQWRYVAGLLLIISILPAGRIYAQADEDVPVGMRSFSKKTEKLPSQSRVSSSGGERRKATAQSRQALASAVIGREALAFSANAHADVPNFTKRSCVSCHSGQASGRHTTRAGLACVQCHGNGIIPGNRNHFSPINPARRHALCARCHEGATPSFAAYIVHEPPPGALETAKTFPALFWVFWAMVGLAGATFGLFVPHAALWGLRECIGLLQKAKEESS